MESSEYARLQYVEAVLGIALYDDPVRQDIAYSHPEQLDPNDSPERRHIAVLASNRLLHAYFADRDAARDAAKAAGQAFEEDLFGHTWEPSPAQIETARSQTDPVLARRIAMIDNFEKFAGYNAAAANTAGVKLREHQQEIAPRMLEFLRESVGSPAWIDTHPALTPDRRWQIRTAQNTMPTGGGKTVWAGRTMEGVGIGQPISDQHPEPARAIYIVTGERLLRQAVSGDKDTMSLLEIAPSLGSVSAFFAGKKDISGNVVAVNAASLKELLQSGAAESIGPSLIFFDEDHHATAELTRPLLEELIIRTGALAIGMTATPYYNITDRHANDIFAFELYKERMLKYVQDGILNSVRLVGISAARSLAADQLAALLRGRDRPKRMKIDRELRMKLGADFAATLAHLGMQGLLVCDRGGFYNGIPVVAAHAYTVRDRIREHGVTAEVIESTLAGDQRDSVEKGIRNGETSVLVTTDMMREGSDLPLNFVGMIRRSRSLVVLEQAVGRALRYNRDRPVSVLFQTLSLLQGLPEMGDATIWNLFDEAYVEQGKVIGPHQENPNAYGRDWARGPQELFEHADPAMSRAINHINHKTIREALFGPYSSWPPAEGSVGFRTLLGPDEPPMSAVTMYGYLQRNGVPYTNNYNPATRESDVYFPAEFQQVMKASVKPKAGPEMRVVGAMEEEWGESHTLINRAIDALSITGTDLRNTRNIESTHYNPNQRRQIKAWIDALPTASPTDVRVSALADELGANRAQLNTFFDTSVSEKRMGPRLRTAHYVTAEEAARARSNPELGAPEPPKGETWISVSGAVIESGRRRDEVEQAMDELGITSTLRTYRVSITRPAAESAEPQTTVEALKSMREPDYKRLLQHLKKTAFPDGEGLSAYLRRTGYTEKDVRAFAADNGIAFTTIRRGKATYIFIKPDTGMRLNKAIAQREIARPGWHQTQAVADMIGVKYGQVHSRLPKADDANVRKMSPDAATLGARTHISPATISDITYYYVGRRIKTDPQVNLAQLSLYAQESPEAVTARLTSAGVTLPRDGSFTGRAAQEVWDIVTGSRGGATGEVVDREVLPDAAATLRIDLTTLLQAVSTPDEIVTRRDLTTACRTIMAQTLANEPHRNLNVNQIALVVGQDPTDVFIGIQRLLQERPVDYEAHIYGNRKLDKILDHFGVSLR